jgi:hypothetical protein
MSDRRERIVVGKTRLGEDDGSFDATFWSALSPEERLEATWQAVLDWAAMRGVDERELRLQRSVVRVERR